MPSGKTSRFPTQQPNGLPTLSPAAMPSKKLIPSSEPSYQPNDSLTVALSVHPSTLPSILPTILHSDVRSKKIVTIQAFVHYRIQIVWQFWFHIFNVVTYQPMFQVCTQAVDQVMGLPVFQYWIIDSNLVHHSHKPHLSLPVSISVPYPVGMYQPPSSHTNIWWSIQWETFTITKFFV